MIVTSTQLRTLPAWKVMDGFGMVKSTLSRAVPPVIDRVTVTGIAAVEDSSPHTWPELPSSIVQEGSWNVTVTTVSD